MSNWPTKRLTDLCSIEIGRTPARDNPRYWDAEKQTENTWISIADMREGMSVIDASKEHLSDAGAAITPIVPEGALLLSFKLSLGKLAFTGKALRTNEAIAALIPHDNKLLMPEFLYWYLKSFDWASAAKGSEKVKGATLNKAKLKEIPVPLPSLAEQRQIVAILDEAFEGIAKATANTERNLASTHELFDAALRTSIDTATVGAPLRTLAEVSKQFGRGKSRHRPRNDPALYGGPYPFIQTGDVRNAGHYITEFTQTYSEVGLRQSKLWPAGTICITIAANIAETGVLTFDACFPDSVIGIVVDEEFVNSDYVEYVLQYFRAHLKAQGKGSAQDNINLGTFENARFPFPKLNVQNDVVSRLNMLDEQTQKLFESYTARISTLAELQQSLLSKAFSGQLTGKEAIAA